MYKRQTYGTAIEATLEASLKLRVALLFTVSKSLSALPIIIATSCLVAFTLAPDELINPGISEIVTIPFSSP